MDATSVGRTVTEGKVATFAIEDVMICPLECKKSCFCSFSTQNVSSRYSVGLVFGAHSTLAGLGANDL